MVSHDIRTPMVMSPWRGHWKERLAISHLTEQAAAILRDRRLQFSVLISSLGRAKSAGRPRSRATPLAN